MKITLIIVAIVASLLIAGCGGGVEAPSLQLGGNLPLNLAEKSMTFSVKNVGPTRTPAMIISATQTATTSLTIKVTDNKGKYLRSTGLEPVAYVTNSCLISYDELNWDTPETDLLDRIDIRPLNPGETVTLEFRRK